MKSCLLCKTTNTILYHTHKNRTFCKCLACGSVFLDPLLLPNKIDEKNRYQLHQNNEDDIGYQNFVTPLINEVISQTDTKQLGLDFGSGPTPIISILLKKLGYNLLQYDPYFCNQPNVFNLKYDFIISCEVIEHLHKPLVEFTRLYSCLKENGRLFCMTDLLPTKTEFSNWYYKNDSTHVIFYSPKSLEWIKRSCGFKSVEIKNRVIIFTK